jgi:carbonic anhydrase
MNRLIQGIQQFQKNVFPANRDLFQRLASSQKPEALFITCSDSRVSPEWVTQCGPGDLFVCRNAGNLVPGNTRADAVSATIEYAISALGIEHIVVCGHSDCGAMKGLMNPANLAEMPGVRSWLRHAEAAYRTLVDDLPDGQPPEALATLAKLNVRLQLEHLAMHPQVLSSLRAGTVTLHGWYYQIESGEVQFWNEAEGAWAAAGESGDGLAVSGSAVRGARHA